MNGARERASWGKSRSRRIPTLFLRIGVLMLGLLLFLPRSVPAQETTQNPFAQPKGPGGVEEAGILSNFSFLLFPKIFADSDILRQYVRTPEYADVRRRSGDLVAVDSLFVHARSLSWENGAEALLIAFAATLDHRRFGVKTPIPGVILWFPLTSESEEDFSARVSALPVRLYPDTPESPTGDRDKLQHFFGSAALTYICESRDPAMRVGDFIEWGEDRFVVDGVLDERDIRANWQGQQFGLRLLADPSASPSSFFRTVIARGPDMSAPHDSLGRVTNRYREGP